MNQPNNPPPPTSLNDSNPTNATYKAKRPFSFWLSWLLAGLLIFSLVGFSSWQKTRPPQVKALTREGVITKIQSLNRLQTVVYNVDTVITSQKAGNWYTLWQDQQKALFVAHGRVQAGVDLNQLTANQVQVSEDGKQINITLPPAQVFETYLDKLDVYDIKTGLFGMVDVDPQLFSQAQASGKQQVLTTACRGELLNMATDNAQKQVQALFSLANLQVTVHTVAPKSCA